MKSSIITRKLLAAIILLAYLLSATACREWLKLPFLYDHYVAYSSGNSHAGFLQFLHDHYWHEKTPVQDTDDRRLPFHSIEYNNTLQFISTEPRSFIEQLNRPLAFHRFVYPLSRHEIVPDGYLSRIWQPPRMA